MRTNALSTATTDLGTPDNSFMGEIEDGICPPVTPGDYSILDQSGGDPIGALVRLLARQLAEERIDGTGTTDVTRNSE